MKKYFSLIVFAHTVFALPFAVIGYLLGTQHIGTSPQIETFAYITLCMIFARSAAMAFNRYLDRDIDAINPRTAMREIPAGEISANNALFFVIVNAAAFIFCTYLINKTCFLLSPIALLVILGYSYTKRFTFLCHFILGLGLSLAPIGAYIAVTNEFGFLPLVYSGLVLLWVSGFDIIYALQDDSFDATNGLYSVPSTFGRARAMNISNGLHVLCGLIMVGITVYLFKSDLPLKYIQIVGAVIFISMLVYQHSIISVNNLSKVNRAFFTTNGIASVVYGCFFVLDYFI